MARLTARICFALALIAAASTTTTTHATTAVQWEDDYKTWMKDIKASVAGNADLEKKAAELQAQLDAAIAAGVPEEDRMRLLYDFLGVVDSDPTFVGFTTKETSATSAPTSSPSSAATTASAPAPTPSSAAASLSLASMAMIAVTVVGYALL